MRVRVLGCRGGWPGAGLACSGYLVEAGGVRVLVDVGAGVVGELLRHTTLAELDAVWVTHMHPDHCGDLAILWHTLAYGTPLGRALPVLGPPGWGDRVGAFIDKPGEFHAIFEVVEVRDGGVYEFGGLSLRAVEMLHSMPTFGVRASHGGAVLGYTGDTAPCPGLDEVARGADLLLCEAFLSLPELTSSALCRPEDAGRAAAKGGARRLVLTHLHPEADPGEAVRRARTEFGGAVEVAHPGREFGVFRGEP